MKIIDCFSYFNEKELLELRIKLLYDKVDKFIITDADKTHKGDNKPFTCKNTLIELGLYPDNKIEIIEVNLPSYEEEPNAWVRERLQRDIVEKFIPEDSYCIITDCDEIINPEFIDYYINVAKYNPDKIVRIPMVFLNNKADLRVYNKNNEPILWGAGFVCSKNQLKDYTISQIRESYTLQKNNIKYQDIFLVDNGVVLDAGWHFSWMGDYERLLTKNNAFLHWDEVKITENYIAKENNIDCLGREDHILKKYPIENLPLKIFELDRVRNFLFPKSEVFNYYEEKPKSIVQIGTNKANDALSNYILSKIKNIKLGIFVEPNSMYNEDIKKCYSKYNNIFIENVAIVPQHQKEVLMYYHTGDPTLETMSCKLDHIYKHKSYYSHGEIKSFYVLGMTLKELFIKYNINELDWLLIDVEGMDADIILSFDWENYNIKKIEFEYIHMGELVNKIKNKFYNMGYKKVKSLHEFDWAFEKI
jgi:hypothetical protein